MAVTYRNTRTGRSVDLDEGDPRIPELDRGKRWERVTPGQAVAATEPEPEDDEPSDAEVRAWARENDLEVPSRGRLPAALVERYRAAQG